MAHLIRLPVMGQTMEEGTILRWFKQEGESIEKGEPLAEIMTDKVNMEMESPESGVVLKLIEPPDAVVSVKAPICIVGEPGEDVSALLAVGGAPPDAAGAASLAGSVRPVAGTSRAVIVLLLLTCLRTPVDRSMRCLQALLHRAPQRHVARVEVKPGPDPIGDVGITDAAGRIGEAKRAAGSRRTERS
jgi:pyruvate/2-oxoglutarate dehydrogenase complex dihydrolipoamide acyltransferase (E2) component